MCIYASAELWTALPQRQEQDSLRKQYAPGSPALIIAGHTDLQAMYRDSAARRVIVLPSNPLVSMSLSHSTKLALLGAQPPQPVFSRGDDEILF